MKNRHLSQRAIFLPLPWMLAGSLLGAGNASAAGKSLQTTISTTTTAIGLQAGDDMLRVVSLKCVAGTADWTAGCAEPASIPMISAVEAGGRSLPVHWRFAGTRKDSGTSEIVLLFCCDEPALELRSIWRAYPGPGPIEHRIQIVNRGAEEVALPLQPTLAFSLRAPPGRILEQWWVERGGSRPSDFGTHREPVTPGFQSSLVSTSHGGPIPWCSVQDVEGRRGWYAGIKFSGIVRMRLQAGAAGTPQAGTARAQFGLGRSDSEERAYRTRLPAGETFETPTVFVGCYAGDVDDGCNGLRRWVEAHLRPASRANLPLLNCNTWGEGVAIDQAKGRRMIDSSAELGIELYHVDAGWFRHVGDWRADPQKFPVGMAALADYAHGKGLRFGLWIAWTQGGDLAGPDRPGAVLSVREPSMRYWFPRDYPPAWRNSAFTGATVCLAESKAAEWCLGDVRRAVKEFKLDLLEHDQVQIVQSCDRRNHRHTSSPLDVAFHAALGYYRVQDGLRASFPDLLFEDCCDGGNLVDYGVLGRSHYVSITDVYDPLSNRRAFYDASYALPPSMCECYVENRPGKRPANFLNMLRSGMMGWCTIMIDMDRWSPEQRAAARREFEVYKTTLRPLIQHADLYHVSERPDGRRWDGMEYYDRGTGRGALLAFRGTTAKNSHRFRLKGLAADLRYRLLCQDSSSPPAVMTGRELGESGVAVVLPEPESSEVVYLARQ